MARKVTENKIKELAREVTQKAEPYIGELIAKADPAIQLAKKTTAPAVEAAKKQSKKATDAAANAAARFTCKEEVFVQYGNYEVRTRDIVDRAKSDYISKGHSQKDIKEIQIYIKPADNAAYYVVNNTDTGKLEV